MDLKNSQPFGENARLPQGDFFDTLYGKLRIEPKRKMAVITKWLLLLLQLTVMTSHGEPATRRRPSAPVGGSSSCHVTQTGTGCRYALSLLPLSGGGATCSQQRRHGNVTSSTTEDGDVITDKLDDAVVKVTRMMKQLSVRCLRHLRQIKAELRKVRAAVYSITS